MTQIAQAKLQSGTSIVTAWVDLKRGVRVGSFVTLKGDEPRRWEVLSLGQPKDADEISNLGHRHKGEIYGGLRA